MKTIKGFDLVKSITYLILLVIVLLTYKKVGYYANYVIGPTMIIHSIFELINGLYYQESKQKLPIIIAYCALLVFGVVVTFLNGNDYLVLLCYFWAIWSIIRELNEIAECIILHDQHIIFIILDMVESIVCIVFAIILLINPTLEHLEIHYILLVVEFSTTALFPILNKLIMKKSVEK